MAIFVLFYIRLNEDIGFAYFVLPVLFKIEANNLINRVPSEERGYGIDGAKQRTI